MANETCAVALTRDEAEALSYHLSTSILEEIQNVEEDNDNYLITLCEIYKRCKAVKEAADDTRTKD